MMNSLRFILFFAFVILIPFESAWAVTSNDLPLDTGLKNHNLCFADILACKEKLKISNANFPLYASRGSKQIEKVIIVIHGTGRNADEYLRDFISNINDQSLLQNTAVVAPHFIQVNDAFEENDLRWKQGWTNSWKYGFNSGAPIEMSSFGVIDQLIKSIDLNWHPKNIMIVGHSAGGQFVQRYAHGTRVANEIKSKMSFVVSNPSSFLYDTPVRLNDNVWETPKDCPEYDDYIYGLNNLNEYLSKFPKESLVKNYLENKVIYLMGGADTLSEDLDTSCEANAQGINRIDRAKKYFRYLKHFFPLHQHRFITVPGVGHDHVKMFSSQQFTDLLSFSQKAGFTEDIEIDKLGNQDISGVHPEALYFLAGGGENDDQAFVEYLKSLKGGDLLILSGKDEPLDYNNYFVDLALKNLIPLNSVTTVLIHARNGAYDPRLVSLISKSEGIFFSGGDQWKYVQRLRGTPSLMAINEKLNSGIPFGGTSAGLAILGDIIFTAQKGSVSSDEVSTDPMNEKITLEKSMFNISMLKNILTDTHFVARDRMGRLLSFLAKSYVMNKKSYTGVGVDEDSILIINKDGDAQVMGIGGAYLVRPISTPIIYNGNFDWEKIQVNRYKVGSKFSFLNLPAPDYFYTIKNGKLFSSQAGGEIY